MKATSKSCSCRQCKFAKHKVGGKKLVKAENRAFRHHSNQALRAGYADNLLPAIHGSR